MTDCTSVIKHNHSLLHWLKKEKRREKRFLTLNEMGDFALNAGTAFLLEVAKQTMWVSPLSSVRKFIWLLWQDARVIVARSVFFTTALLFCCENSQHGVAHPPLARHCCQS